ncbi:hypothetical protein RUM44_004627 [Polyplax serrata]|uniref:Uncharacterized protein n=1 Tax=Polyplax serrata TaxID=468196 RepID=A0ABR1B3D9_POLSC
MEQNRLKCDCHISWIHTLRNETLNTEMRLALEDLTCIMESDGTTNLSLMTTEKPQDDQTYTVDVNSLQYDDEDVEYDDDIASTEYDNEAGKPPRRKIVDIPVEKLPCPEMQKATTEVPAAKNSMSWPEAASSNIVSDTVRRLSASGDSGEIWGTYEPTCDVIWRFLRILVHVHCQMSISYIRSPPGLLNKVFSSLNPDVDVLLHHDVTPNIVRVIV